MKIKAVDLDNPLPNLTKITNLRTGETKEIHSSLSHLILEGEPAESYEDLKIEGPLECSLLVITNCNIIIEGDIQARLLFITAQNDIFLTGSLHSTSLRIGNFSFSFGAFLDNRQINIIPEKDGFKAGQGFLQHLRSKGEMKSYLFS
ncbi:MAG: hypothetical protein ACM3UU_10335 [Ignavibacteriales bacterium]